MEGKKPINTYGTQFGLFGAALQEGGAACGGGPRPGSCFGLFVGSGMKIAVGVDVGKTPGGIKIKGRQGNTFILLVLVK